ncbi:UDP-N-acetylmuramoyl-tripeptide--D-alanyl-D-alanine ligase [Bacteroidota bacterium]
MKFTECKGFSTDSRNIQKDIIFFALKGRNFDGNQFAEEALEKGAKYAVIDNPEYKSNKLLLLVQDVLQVFQEISTIHRRKLNIPIIAITGSNGKTTTKELISKVLSNKFVVGKTIGNLNNHIGVPHTLLSFNTKTEIGIVEMGANHVGEIKQLCEITEPNFGIITNIGEAHLEGFGSFENVIKAKTELYEYLKINNGCIFLNLNDKILSKYPRDNLSIITYGTKKGSFCTGEIIQARPYLNFKTTINNKEIEIKTKIYGDYNFENYLAAFCLGRYFNVKTEKIIHSLENYIPKNQRSQVIHTNNNTLFFDAYNANPTSMIASLSSFDKLEIKNKCLIIGEMYELGIYTEAEHRKVVEFIKNLTNYNDVIFIGKSFHIEKNPFKTYKNISEFVDEIENHELKGCNILIKGSRGNKLEKILEWL